MTDEHRNAKTLSVMEGWKNGRLKRTIKESSQFDNKKPEELESEFDHFDPANSYPTSPFKGRNIVDLDFVHKQLLDGHKPCNTTLSLTQYQRESFIDRSYKHFIPQFAELQYCNDGQSKHLRCRCMLCVQQIRIRSSCCESTCESG